MTTETPKAAEKTPQASTPTDEEKSLLPTVLAFAAILLAAGLLIFWPSGDEEGEGKDGKAVAGAGEGKGAGGADGPAGRAGGVGARQIDAATTPDRANRNPAIKMPPAARGMAPMPEALPKDPPADAPVADKIAFYEKRLEQAIRIRDTRKKFVERLPEVKSRIETAPNPDQGLAAFEKREKIVQDNYAKAQADVEDLEKKLAELRGN